MNISANIIKSIILGAITIISPLSAMENLEKPEEEALACSICTEDYDNVYRLKLKTPCGHELCLSCTRTAIGEGYQHVDPIWGVSHPRHNRCPFCRKEINKLAFLKMWREANSAMIKEIEIKNRAKAEQDNNPLRVIEKVDDGNGGYKNLIITPNGAFFQKNK